MRKNKFIIVFICVITLFILANTYILFEKFGFHLIGNFNNTDLYSSTNGMYSILIPSAWAVNEIKTPLSGDEFLITNFTTISSKIYLNVHKYRYTANLENELCENRLESVNNFPGFELINQSENFHDDLKMTILEYLYIRVKKNYQYHCYDIIIPINGGYVFSLCSEASLWKYAQPMFDEMSKSISIESSN